MTIAFSCSCGKAMKAKDAFAGRKTKCSACGNVVQIPLAEPAEAEVPTARATQPRPTQPRAQVLSRPTSESGGDDVPPFAKRPAQSLFTDDDDDLDSAPPRAEPVVAFGRHDDESPPLARPVARPALKERPAEAEPAAVNVWVDSSLVQTSTPWLPGDEVRFQQGVAAPREGLSGLAVGIVSVVVLAALGTAAWLWIGR